MERARTGDVRVPGNETGDRGDLGFRGREWTSADLFVLGAPVRRKVAIQIQSLLARLQPYGDTVVDFETSLGQQAVILSARLGRLAAYQNAWVFRARFPRSVGVGNTHRQDASVAVDVFPDQSAHRFLVIGIGPGAGTDQLGHVRERPLRAVGIYARTDVEGAGVETTGDLGVAPIAGKQALDEMKAGAGTRQFSGVDVAVHPEGGLIHVEPGLVAGDTHHVDFAPFVALTDRL